MFDYNKRIDASQGQERITVENLIEYLKTLNKDAKISVLGDPCFYIHVEQDGSEVIFDDSPLEDEYPMDNSMSNYLERNKEDKKSKRKEREERKKELNRAYGKAVMKWEDENDEEDMEEMVNLFVEFINAPSDKKVLYIDKIKELYMKVDKMDRKTADKLILRILKKDEEETAKKAKEKYEENIKAQTEIPVNEADNQELRNAGPHLEAFLQHLHYSKKGPDNFKEMLTGKINPDTFKEAVGIGDCRNSFEAMMHSHLNRIVAIATPEYLVIALVTTHKGKLVVIPQCPNNKPVYLQEQRVLNINGINFQVNTILKSLYPERLAVTDIFKLSRLAEMVIPDAIEYVMKREDYDARYDKEAKKIKDAYKLISENYNSKFGPLVPLVIPVKH